jgi:pyridoxal phosphate enzyme (YggS family)
MPRSIAENVAEVRAKIAVAATRSGRGADEVTLVAVSKYVGDAEIAELLAAGCRDLGESRPQDLWRKAPLFAAALPRDDRLSWHFIGHLQTNKIDRTLPLAALVHSLDRESLVQPLQQSAQKQSLVVPVLVEVNISGDAAKHGFRAGDVETLLEKLAALPNLAVRGLMGMAGLESDPDQARREFANLRELLDRLQKICPPTVQLKDLSMGMSGDYEIAIEEGATIVRVGSALFEI